MTSRISIFAALTLGLSLLFGSAALAQSSQDMSLLTAQERHEYNQRLQQATSSADRARITAEMNRIIQQRRLEQRQQLQQQQGVPGVNQGQGYGQGIGGGQGHGNTAGGMGGGKGKK